MQLPGEDRHGIGGAELRRNEIHADPDARLRGQDGERLAARHGRGGWPRHGFRLFGRNDRGDRKEEGGDGNELHA